MKELVFELGGAHAVKKMLGVNYSTVWRWETNKVRMLQEHYRPIMKKTGLTFQELELINYKA